MQLNIFGQIHISERIRRSLEGHGFKFSASVDAWVAKRNFPHLAGSVSNGNRVVKVRFSESLQWVESLGRWGEVVAQYNMHEYYGPDEAAHAKDIVRELIGDPAL